MNQRRMPSPAIVVAVLALVAALAGTAMAGSDASTSAISKKKVKKIVKKQINKLAPGLSVASAETANTADTATNAQNANNANAVDGNSIVDFSLNGVAPMAERQILNLGGLQLRASCDPANGGSVTVTARTTVNGGEIATVEHDAADPDPAGQTEEASDDNFGVDDALELPDALTHTDVVGDGRYIGGDLRHVAFFWHEEDDVGSNGCVLNGYAIG